MLPAKFQSTLIFAHRGASQEAAENTRGAFDRALQLGVDGIETDIQLTQDEFLVLWHDRFLGKLGYPTRHIDDFSFEELRTMNFAAHFPSGSKPEVMMTLADFLTAYSKRTRLLLEIKNRAWEDTRRHEIKIRGTLQAVGSIISDTALISSFNLQSLIFAHQISPEFPLIYNLEDDQTLADMQHVLSQHSFLYGLCLPISSLHATAVQLLREQGKYIAVYTCNTEEEIGKALELKVDVLISDVPHKALKMRDA